MRRWLWFLGGGLILVGAAGLPWISVVQGGPWQIAQMMGSGGGMMGPGIGPGMMGGWSAQWYGKKKFASDGEQIYFTGVSAKTGPIPRAGGPMWVQMGGAACAACHGIQGRGGVPVMMGTAIPADIRYEALIKGEYEHGKKETPYTDALIKRAVTEGLDPDGKPLDWTMPRWQMRETDLGDVLAYLNTLR
jgi:mono/diheme cytochrome c family protein